MAKFSDAKDREWIVDVTVGTIKKVRKALDIDLADPSGADVNRMVDDPVLLVDTLWLLCEDQAKEKKITDEDFGRGLVGDPIELATTALLDAVADFFPGPKRSLLRKATEKMTAIRRKAEAIAMEKIDDPQIEKKLEAVMIKRIDVELNAVLTRLNGPTNLPEPLSFRAAVSLMSAARSTPGAWLDRVFVLGAVARSSRCSCASPRRWSSGLELVARAR